MKTITLLMLVFLLVGCGGGTRAIPETNFQSWYVPGYGTINVNEGQTPNPAVMEYGPFSGDIVVLSDLGRSVDYIQANGVTRWRFYEPYRIRGLQQVGNTVTFISATSVVVLDLATGEELRRIRLLHVGSMNSFVPVEKGFLATINADGTNTVMLLNHSHQIIWKNPYRASYPRSAEMVGNVVIVADTFGHRVYGVDITTDQIVFEYDEYFPNQVEQTDHGLLVVGEHSNRVYLLNTNSGVRNVVYTCQASPFDNIYLTSDEIKTLEEGTSLLLEPDKPTTSKSVCAQDLYSPNGAALISRSHAVIASTDDGCVFEVRSGTKTALICGFNNPANVIYVN